MNKVVIAFDCIFPNQTGGAEKVYREIATGLSERGFDVEYLTRDSRSDEELSFEVTPIWDGEIYDSEGVRKIKPALQFSSNLFRALVKRREEELYIVSSTPVLNVIAATFALAGSPRKHLVIDWIEIWPVRKWLKYSGVVNGLLAWILQQFALMLTVRASANSRQTISRMPKRLRNSSPTLLSLATLETETTFAPTSSTDSQIVLLSVGRLIRDKQFHLIPPVLHQLKEKYPSAKSVIVGEGPERSAIEEAAVKYGVAESVTLMGRISDDSLSDLLKEATVLFHPSIREGFGLVVTEAASVGTPSVLIPGSENAAADLIIQGTNGYLSASDNAADICSAIVDAINGGNKLRRSTFEWRASLFENGSFNDALDVLTSFARNYEMDSID